METVMVSTSDGVHEVIEHPTMSVVQISGMPGHVGSDGDNAGGSTDEDSAESRKRREMLARRPSYRKILNELSSTDGHTITVAKIEEESNDSHSSESEGNEAATNLSSSVVVPFQQSVVPQQTIQIAGHGDGSTAGMQTLTMTNVASTTGSSPAGTTIVQYAQSADGGQFFIPGNLSTIGNVQYQIAPTSLPQGVVMATAGTTLGSAAHLTEEASRKRELRLLKNRLVEQRKSKNREAARECRRKKKEYVKCLENRVAVLENQNKTLIEELKSLKELYCQKESQS